MPLAVAHGHALEQDEGESCRKGVHYLDVALRRHRLLRDRPSPPTAAAPSPQPPRPRDPRPRAAAAGGRARELRLFSHVLERAACLGAVSVLRPPSRCPTRHASCCVTSRATCPTSTFTTHSSRLTGWRRRWPPPTPSSRRTRSMRSPPTGPSRTCRPSPRRPSSSGL
ncbi:endoplasmic reticulum protein SC65-like [Vicugna pacos]|uniref:Endoplasmic reticulum protein SC65-like n=1 Tax=Vicugna pacos TaxID=30538 RepID=A0ABM5BEK4_VICPA